MKTTRFKSAHATKHGIQPSKVTLFHIIVAVVGFIGVVVFGFLMDKLLAPIREASGAPADNGFNTFTDGLIIPAFLLSVCLCFYGVYSLYKVYRQLNDPKSYGNRSRHTSS